MTYVTKLIFDQLTEDADKLIQNGDYNVYHEEQEVLEREAAGALQHGYTNGSDYVFDESSGSNLGYYYDPNTGLYCSATTGKWYKYNDETKEYEEVVSEVATGEV